MPEQDAGERYADQVRTILEGFRHELCSECSGDVQRHVLSPDVLGNAHAWCIEGREDVLEFACRGCDFRTADPRECLSHAEKDTCRRMGDLEAEGWRVERAKKAGAR